MQSKGRALEYVAVAATIVALSAAVVLVLDKPVLSGSIRESLGVEVYQLLLQFLLVTVTGGMFFLFFDLYKERRARNDLLARETVSNRERLALLRLDFLNETDGLYRGSKHAKRLLRAYVNGGDRDVDRDAFERILAEIGDIQTGIENKRETVKARSDLFDSSTRNRLVQAFEYCATYLHDVYEDFESGRVKRTASGYGIDPACTMIRDFIGREELSGELKRLTDEIDDDCRSLADRAGDLERLFDGTFGAERYRLRRPVAEACFRLSLDLIRNEAIPASGAPAIGSRPDG